MSDSNRPPLNTYYCYACERQFEGRYRQSDFPICSNCGSDAVEALTNNQVQEPERPSIMIEHHEIRLPEGVRNNSNGPTQSHVLTIGVSQDDLRNNPSAQLVQQIMSATNGILSQITQNGPPRQASVSIGGSNEIPINLTEIFNGLPSALNGEGINSDPRNFAWGIQGMENVLTRLLNEAGNEGRTPCSEDVINNIPIIELDERAVEKMKKDNNIECSVCMAEFTPSTLVKKLKCNHTFHTDCIDPWLRIQSTCPVCRKKVEQEINIEAGASGTTDGPHPNSQTSSSSTPGILGNLTNLFRNVTGQNNNSTERSGSSGSSGGNGSSSSGRPKSPNPPSYFS